MPVRGYWKTRRKTKKEIFASRQSAYIHIRCYLHGTVFTTIVAIGVETRHTRKRTLACLFTYGCYTTPPPSLPRAVTRAIFKFLPRTHWEYNICGWNGTRGGGGGRNIAKIKSRPDASSFHQIFRGFGYIFERLENSTSRKYAQNSWTLVNETILAGRDEKLYQTLFVGEFVSVFGDLLIFSLILIMIKWNK